MNETEKTEAKEEYEIIFGTDVNASNQVRAITLSRSVIDRIVQKNIEAKEEDADYDRLMIKLNWNIGELRVFFTEHMLVCPEKYLDGEQEKDK